jgi:hypothetical protein
VAAIRELPVPLPRAEEKPRPISPAPKTATAPAGTGTENEAKIATLVKKAKKDGVPDSIIQEIIHQAPAKHQAPDDIIDALEAELERRNFARRPTPPVETGNEPAPPALGKQLETPELNREGPMDKIERKLEKQERKQRKFEEKLEKSKKHKGMD